MTILSVATFFSENPVQSVETAKIIRKPVYLDYAATTPVAPEVAERMAACLTLDGTFANPASRSHLYGWQAEEVVEEARAQVAALIGADAREVVWTSGATEANNLALKGAAEAWRESHPDGGHIIVSAIEHKAVLDPVLWLEQQGFSVTRLQPDHYGQISPQQVAAAITDDTFLISIMQVNNELGTINDVQAIGEIAHKHQCLFHVDAAQSAGKLAIDVSTGNVDLLSLSAHKFYGPKGIGALYVRRHGDVKVKAIIHGGGHERGFRSGTLPTHQCVGMGLAAQLAADHLADEPLRITALRDHLWRGISDLPDVQLNGHPQDRACGHLNVAFGGCNGETLLLSLRELAVSSGSACNSASLSPSYVLKAIGLTDALAQASLRFSVGRYTTRDEIDFAIEHIRQVVKKIHHL